MASRKKGQLPPKRIAWANAYLANGFDGVDAARTAKYSTKRLKQAAYENLHDSLVKAYLDERMKVMQMSADEALTRLAEHGRGQVTDFIGLTVDELKQHPKAWLVKKIEIDVAFPPEKSEEKPIQYVKRVELHDPQAAINTILKQLQLASGQPTEIVGMLPALEKFIELAQGVGKDPRLIIERMVNRLTTEQKLQ